MRTKWFVLLMYPLIFGSCVQPQSTKSSTPATVSEAIKANEQSGVVPSLNHDSTLLGPDTDNNKVRDDIDAYISKLPDTNVQKSSLRQVSTALSQAMAVDITNQSALVVVSRQVSNAVACAHARYDSKTASKKTAEMRKLTINTKVRLQAYVKFSIALNGKQIVLPEGSGCEN
jgi:hypothetical protein